MMSGACTITDWRQRTGESSEKNKKKKKKKKSKKYRVGNLTASIKCLNASSAISSFPELSS
jgi:hypothetical protein